MSTTPGESSGLGEQNSAYRKGFVLGLTMAETAILIIFVLLLLLMDVNRRGERIAQQFSGHEPVSRSRLGELMASEAAFQEAAKTLGMGSEPIPEDFVKLIRVVSEAVKTPEVGSLLREGEREIAAQREARKQLQSIVAAMGDSGALSLDSVIEQQAFRIANQEGQMKGLENRLAASGERRGERACWADRFGKNEYLYDIVLTSGGIRMREYRYPSRARERTLLPAPEVDPARQLTPDEFYQLTRPLYLHSLQMNCRYFVIVYDATAPHEKPLYKSLLKTVEGHFYKFLSDQPAPF